MSLYVLCGVHPALRAHAPIPLLETLNTQQTLLETLDTLRKSHVAMSGVVNSQTVFCLRKMQASIKLFAQLDFGQFGILHNFTRCIFKSPLLC